MLRGEEAKSKNGTLAEIELQKIGVASVNLKSLNGCCEDTRETFELGRLHPPSQRLWECRAAFVESRGVLVASNTMAALLTGAFIISRPKYYTLSLGSEQSFLKFLLSIELSE